MATSVTITATLDNGKPISVLEDLIDKRANVLEETSAEATIATAITILTSIRARTKVADAKKAGGFVTVAPCPTVSLGWRRFGGKNVVCLREPGAADNRGRHPPRLKLPLVCVCDPRRSVTPTVGVYLAIDRVSDRIDYKEERYYIVAANEADAKRTAAERRAKRLARYCGLAKWLAGQAQSQISRRDVTSGVAPTELMRKLLPIALQTAVNETGWNDGSVTVEVADKLKYAILALKHGHADFELAWQKAANSTAAKLNKLGGLRLDEEIPTPFPEAKG